jgi:glycerol-3-phosphate dehydrogenase
VKERTSDLSRRHQVTDSHDGVVHITGGKWTTYRQMAEDTVDALRPYLDGLRSTRTKNLRLHGVGPWRPTTERETNLYRRFGDEATIILEMIATNGELGECPIEGQPYVGAEFLFAARFEMATSLTDLLTRRTRSHLHDARATLRAAPLVVALVADELGWGEADVQRELAEYESLVRDEFGSAGLTL